LIAPGKGARMVASRSFFSASCSLAWLETSSAFQAVHFLQRHVVAGLRALITARGLIELLL